MKYITGFDETNIISSLESYFDCKLPHLKNEDIIIAIYDYNDYNGISLVIFKYNGILYEVNGLYYELGGFEGQWEPEETLAKLLYERLNNSYSLIDYYSEFTKPILKSLLDEVSN